MPVEIWCMCLFYVSGWFTFKVATVVIGKGISNVFIRWSEKREVEEYEHYDAPKCYPKVFCNLFLGEFSVFRVK